MNALVRSTYFLQGWHLKTNLILEHDITFKLKSLSYTVTFNVNEHNEYKEKLTDCSPKSHIKYLNQR